MSRVAVVFPPLRISRDFIDYPYFADLGALQAAAVLRAAGHEVVTVDALAHPGAGVRSFEGGRVELGAPLSEVLQALPDTDLLLVAFTPFHRPPSREPLLAGLLEVTRERSPTLPILLADLHQTGQHYVDAPDQELLDAYPEADVLLRFEAESTLPGIVTELLTARPAQRRAVHGEEVEDLDELPLPAWSDVDLEAHFRMHETLVAELGRPDWAFPIVGRSLPLLSSRGCPFRCVHCSSNPGLAHGAPKRQRRLSRLGVARRLDQLVALGARRVHVLDELANVNESHFDALLDAIVRRELFLEIPNGLRADYVTDRHIEQLRGRITTLSVSAESGSQRVVSEVVGKELDLACIESVARRAHEADIPLLVHFMLGLPGETRAEIGQTLQLALGLAQRFGATPSVQFATPLPGTALSRLAESRSKRLPLVEDWGPHFQRDPTLDTEAISKADLVSLRSSFETQLALVREPPIVSLDVGYRCNNRCSFCTTGTREQLDIDFSNLCERLERRRTEGARVLRLDGGEPTLHPRLFSLIATARRLGYASISVTTNGRMAAYPVYAARLANSGASEIRFSLHGATREVHGALVGVAEAFEQTLAGITHVVASAPRGVEVAVTSTLTRTNLHELGALCELSHRLGVRRVDLRLVAPFGADTHMLTPDLADAAGAVMDALKQWRERLRLRVQDLPACLLPGLEQHLSPDELALDGVVIHEGESGVDPARYWRSLREHRPGCDDCPRRPLCSGFFRTRAAEAPMWLLAREPATRSD